MRLELILPAVQVVSRRSLERIACKMEFRDCELLSSYIRLGPQIAQRLPISRDFAACDGERYIRRLCSAVQRGVQAQLPCQRQGCVTEPGQHLRNGNAFGFRGELEHPLRA